MRLFLVIAIIIAIIATSIFYFYPSYSDFRGKVFVLKYPVTDGIGIYCLGEETIDCTDKTTFKCGEKIELVARVSNVSSPFYACMNMSLFGLPLVCTAEETKTPFLFNEPSVTVPDIEGMQKFIEIYWFPPKDYKNLEDFTNDMESSQIIMSLSREVIC